MDISLAIKNQAHVRILMIKNLPEMARALAIVEEELGYPRDEYVVGFGELDFENGETGAHFGSDEDVS